jgi:hypothetical protein
MTTRVGTPRGTADPSTARPGADELAWRELIHKELRGGMVLVGVLAVAALGLAL